MSPLAGAHRRRLVHSVPRATCATVLLGTHSRIVLPLPPDAPDRLRSCGRESGSRAQYTLALEEVRHFSNLDYIIQP